MRAKGNEARQKVSRGRGARLTGKWRVRRELGRDKKAEVVGQIKEMELEYIADKVTPERLG